MTRVQNQFDAPRPYHMHFSGVLMQSEQKPLKLKLNMQNWVKMEQNNFSIGI